MHTMFDILAFCLKMRSINVLDMFIVLELGIPNPMSTNNLRWKS